MIDAKTNLETEKENEALASQLDPSDCSISMVLALMRKETQPG